ncbi:MAG: hypothetical protein ACHQ1D_02775 [Nitrososphaerales archaeon]
MRESFFSFTTIGIDLSNPELRAIPIGIIGVAVNSPSKKTYVLFLYQTPLHLTLANLVKLLIDPLQDAQYVSASRYISTFRIYLLAQVYRDIN